MSLLSSLVKVDVWVMGKLGGKPNETLSSAAWNAHLTNVWWGWTYLLIDLIAYPLEQNHCRKDWEVRKDIYQ